MSRHRGKTSPPARKKPRAEKGQPGANRAGQPSASMFELDPQFTSRFEQAFVPGTGVLRQIRIADQRAERLDQAVQQPSGGTRCDTARLHQLVNVADGCIEVFELRRFARFLLLRNITRHDGPSLLM